MKKYKNILYLAISSIVLIGIDQYTKIAVVNRISLHEQVDVIKDFLYITYLQNTGAAFSMMEGAGNVVFSIITIVALCLLLYLYMHTKDKWMQFAYIIVFAGAIGNYIDRMTLHYVRDFIGVYIFGWTFPIFNFADICITCGFGILIIKMAYDEIKEKSRWKKELSK